MTGTPVRQAIGRFTGSPLRERASKIQAASLGSAPLLPDTTRRNSADDIFRRGERFSRVAQTTILRSAFFQSVKSIP